MILTIIITLILFILSARSITLILWKFKDHQKIYETNHFFILTLCGGLAFCLYFLMNLGSSGHFVSPTTNITQEHIAFTLAIFTMVISVIGFIITIYKSIRNRNSQK